jgi:hypothetical protein
MRNKWNYKLYRDSKVRHHLLEIILWPESDGRLRTIVNSKNRLQELGIYEEGVMTIEMTNGEHISLHNHNRAEDTKRRINEWNRSQIGKTISDETKVKLSIASSGSRNPMYGRDAWAISCSKKTAEEIQATRDSKRSKMKEFWATHPEARAKMAERVRAAKLGRRKEVLPHGQEL